MTRSFQIGTLSLVLLCAILSHSLAKNADTQETKSSFIALEDIVPHSNEIGGWRTVQGNSLYFATAEPAANSAFYAAIHKVSTSANFDDVAVQTISLKEIMGNKSGTVEGMTNTFVTLGNDTIAAATLSSSQLILFTDALEVLAVVDISAGSEGGADYPALFTQLIFFSTPTQKANTKTLGMFGTNSYVSVEIGVSGNVAAATTASKFTFSDWTSFEFSLSNQKVSQIRDVTVNGDQIVFTGFAAEDNHWKLFIMPTVPGSTDCLYSKTEDTLDNQIVDVTVSPIIGQTSNVIFAGYDSFSGVDSTIEIVNNADHNSKTRTLNLPRDHVTGSRMSIQTNMSQSGTLQAALMTRDSVMLFQPSDGTHNPWTQTVATNTCSDFALQHLFLFEDSFWALGLVESPKSTVIDQPSIPQLMRIDLFSSDISIVSSNPSNLFYTQEVNTRFEDRTFDEIDWDKTPSFITKGQYFNFSSPTVPTTPTLIVNQKTNTATAATSVDPLPLLNNSELSGDGYSVSTQLGGSVNGTLVGLSGVELSATKALTGKVTKPSEGTLYGIPTTGNKLLSCFTLPVAVEPTKQSADELIALLTKSGTTTVTDTTSFSAKKSAALGGFFVAVEGVDTDYVNVTRVLASGEVAWQQRLYSQLSFSSKMLIEPIRAGYSQYVVSPFGGGLILVENEAVSWYSAESTDVSEERAITMITAQDDLIYTLNDTNLVTFSMAGSQKNVVTFAIANVTGLTIVAASSNSDYAFVLFNTPTGNTIYLLAIASPNNPTFAEAGQDISEITYNISKPTILATSAETVLIGGYVNAGYSLMIFDSKTNKITSTTTVPTTSSVVSVSAVSTTEALVALEDSVILVTLGETPTAKVMTISLSSLTCTVEDTMPTGLVYTIQLSCTPSISKQTQWAFVTMSTTGEFESKSGNTITVSESTKTVMPTKVTTGVSAKTGTMTFGSTNGIVYQFIGNIAFTQDFVTSISLSDNFAPYDVPTNGGSFTDTVEGNAEVTKTIERSDFGKNLPTDCAYVSDLPDEIDGSTSGEDYKISYDPEANTSSDGKTLSGKVEYRCAGWFIADYDVSLEIEEGAGKFHNPDGSESIFLATSAVLFIFAFMF